MLDIKFIRDNKDIIKDGARKKCIEFDIDSLISVDDERRALQKEFEEMRTKQNQVSAQIPQIQDQEQRGVLISEMKVLKEELQGKESKLKKVITKWQGLMLQVPNVPDMSVPEGKSDEENAVLKEWGEKTHFDFEPKSHVDIMKDLDMVDFERGTKVAGFRGYFLKNDGALLSFAIWQYAQEHFLKQGFTPMIVPSLVGRDAFIGTGYLPQSEDDLYKTQDDMFLAGTAEVATMAYHMDEVVNKEDLPIKYLSFSPCFRREAGSYGRDTKGLIRVHEFYKVEQVMLCEASHQESAQHHEWLNRNTETFIESLGIPYQTVVNCGGDLGLGQVKKFDIELWVPLEKKYREISSTSYFHDFQTRRLNIKYKDDNGRLQFAHSLNSTAIPTPRILVSLIENFQQADGSILIPEPLVKYFGKNKIERRS